MLGFVRVQVAVGAQFLYNHIVCAPFESPQGLTNAPKIMVKYQVLVKISNINDKSNITNPSADVVM